MRIIEVISYCYRVSRGCGETGAATCFVVLGMFYQFNWLSTNIRAEFGK